MACVAMAFTLTVARSTRAADIVFQQSVLDGTNYDWSNPANWVGGMLPGSGDQADIGNGFTATINGGSDLINSLFLGADPAAGTTGNGTLNQTSGNLIVLSTGLLGNQNGTTGTYSISGNSILTGGTFTIGQDGTGIFNIGGSSTVSLTDLNIGNLTDGLGTVTQSGSSNVFVGGTLTVGATNKGGSVADQSTVGASSYNLNGGTLTTGTLNIAPNAANGGSSDGLFTISGTGSLTVNNSGSLNVGNGGSGIGAFIQSGASSVNVTNGNLAIGNGSHGTYTIQNGTGAGPTLTVNGPNNNTIYVGVNGGTGVLNQSTGTINTQNLTISNNNGDVGTYNLSGGTMNVSNNINLGNWDNTNGTLNLSGTGHLNVGNLNIAQWNSASGTITKGVLNQTGGTLTVNNTLELGNNGQGQPENGFYNLSAGTATVNQNLIVANASLSNGEVTVGAGTTLTVGQQVFLGNSANSYGAMTISGGTVGVNSWFAIGRNGGTGVFNMTSGTLNQTGEQFDVGSGGGAAGFGVATLSGGTVNVTNTNGGQGQVWVGEVGAAVLNVSGTASLSTVNGVEFGVNGGASGVLNLSGGTITTPSVSQGGGTGTFNFNGGTLKASASNGSFFGGLTSAYVYSGGGTIDNGGNNITIAQAISAPTGNGVSATGLTVSGGGYLGAPAVQITGGGGTGATANATIDSNGNLTGIVITNPGTGYTSAPTFALVGGGAGNTGAIGGTATLVANTSGGLTFQGAGVTILSGANTFSGATVISSGTLELGNALALQNSSLTSSASAGTLAFAPSIGSFTIGGLTGNGALTFTDTGGGAVTANFGNNNQSTTFTGTTGGFGTLGKIGTGTLTLNNNGSSAINSNVAVSGGTLRITGTVGGTGTVTVGGNGASGIPTLAGTGTLNAVTVINGPGTGVAGILAPSAGGSSPSTLTFGNSLTLNAGSILNLTLSNNLTTGNDKVVLTGGVLSLGATGTVNITDPSGLAAGNYVLISTPSPVTGGAGWTPVISNPGSSQTYVLGPQGTNFDLTVINNSTNPSIAWSGAAGSGGNGTWDIGTTANWYAPSATPVNTFAQGDQVAFGNTYGPSNTPVTNANISISGTVNPILMTFSNTSTVPYTFTSGTIGGTGSAIINGGGTVTFLNTNTFTGGTSVTNGSTLSIGDTGLDSGFYASSVIAVSGAGSTLYVGELGSWAAGSSLVLGSHGVATFNNTSQTLGGLNGDSTTTLTLNGTPLTVNAGGEMDGLITGAGTLNVSGGNLILTNGGNSFSGGTTITSGGTLTINNDGTTTGTNTPLGAIPGSSSNNSLVINGGTLAANGTFTLNANRTILLGPSSGTGSGTLNVTSNNVLTVPGTIANNGSSTSTLNKTGTGTLVLTGTTNTYSGGTTITGGTVRVSNGTNLGGGTVTLNGGTLNVTPTTTLTPGVLGQYWANQNPNNNTFGFTSEASSAAYFAGLPAPTDTQQLPETGPNTVNGWAGGINFSNQGYGGGAAFSPIGITDVGPNNVVARWTGSMILTQTETIQFTTQSDDASFLLLSGNGLTTAQQVVVNNDGGHGANVVNGTITLAPGTYSIDVPYTQGGGGWGIQASYKVNGNTQYIGQDDPTDGVSFGVITFASGINVSNALSVVGSNNTLTLNAATPAVFGALTFSNGAALTVNGSAPSATFTGTTFNGGAVTINNLPNVTTGPVSNGGSALTSLTKTGLGTLSINNSTDPAGAFSGAAINVNGGSLTTLASNTTSGLGSAAKFAINGGNLTLNSAAVGTLGGLTGSYWAKSPDGTNDQNNNWGPGNTNTGATVASINTIITNLGTPFISGGLPNQLSTAVNGTNGPGYANPPGGYVGGIDFPNTGNNGVNIFAAINVNYTGSNPPTFIGPNSGYNSMTAQWTGTVTLTTAGTLNFNQDSDDFSAVIVDGTLVLQRGNGGTGFSGSGTGGAGTTGNIALSAGAHTIQVVWDEGGGGLGIVGEYSFTPTGGSQGGTFFIGQNNTSNTLTGTGSSQLNDPSADAVTFTSTVTGIGFSLSNPITVTGASSLTLNALTASSFTGSPALTLNDQSNLTISGTTPQVSFTTTALNGNSTITASIPVEAGIVSNGGSPAFASLTMAGTSQLFLDNTANSAFSAGTTIRANSGTTVGVNGGGVDSLGLATLNVNGGTFSLGSDGANGSAGDNFANPISLTASGTIIGQQLGAGTVAGSTLNLTGGIATGSTAANVLTLNTANNYMLNVASAITGSGTVNGAGTVNLNVANPSFTGTLRVSGGTTTDNAAGALSTVAGATVNGGQFNIVANNEVVNNLSVNNGGTSTVSGTGVGFSGAANVNTGGALNVNSVLAATSSPLTVNAGGTLNVNTAGSLNGAGLTVGVFSPSVAAGTAIVNGAGSLGVGPVNVFSGSTLKFVGGTGAANYAGSTINVNVGTVNAHTGNTNLGNAVIAVSPVGLYNYNGLQGYATAGVSDGSYGSAAGVLSQINGTPGTKQLLTAAGTPHGDGIDFQSDGDMGNFFGNPSNPTGANIANNQPNPGNYEAVFFGHFTAPKTGFYNFAVLNVDDNGAVYADTSNGTNFTQIANAGCCINNPPNTTAASNPGSVQTLSLTAGQTISMAFAMQDTGGGSGYIAGFEYSATSPFPANNSNYIIVGPGAPGQVGDWTFASAGGGGTIQVDAGASLSAGGFTSASNVVLANGATINLNSSSVTSSATMLQVTDPSNSTPSATLNFAGSGYTLATPAATVGTLSIATGGTLNLTNTGTGTALFQLTGPGDPANTGTLRVGAGAALGGSGLTASHTGSVTVASGGAIVGTTGNLLTIGPGGTSTSGTLTLMSGSNLIFTLPGTPNSSPLISVGTLIPPSSGSSLVTITNATAPAGGVYDLINYFSGPGTATTAANFSVSAAPAGYTYSLSTIAPNGSTPGQLDLTVVQAFFWTAHPGGTGTGMGVDVWDNATANWANGMPLAAATFPATGASADFGDTNPLGGPNPDGTVNIVAGGVTPAGVTFANTAVNYTINDSDGSNGIGGSGGVTINGGGMVTFTGPNSYSGPTSITSGSTLNFSKANQLGGTSGIVLNNGTLNENATGGTPSSPIQVSLGSSQGVQLGNASNPGTINTAANTQLTIPGIVSDNTTGGTLRVGGSGTLILTAANTYTGTTTINSGATLQIGNGLGSGSVGTGNVTANGSLIFDQGGAATVTNNISGAATGSVAVVGGSQVTLTPIIANTYAGPTLISQGTLILGNSNALPSATSVTLGGLGTNGTLDLDGSNATVAGLAVSAASLTPSNQVVSNDVTAVTPSTLTFAGGTGTSTYVGELVDNGSGFSGGGFQPFSLSVTSGTLKLTGGNNGYTGGTTITGGTLIAANPSGSSAVGFGNVTVGDGVHAGSGTLSGSGVANQGFVGQSSSPVTVTVQSGGTLAGVSGGALTVFGPVNLQSGAGLSFNLNHSSAGNSTALIAVNGLLSITGTPAVSIDPNSTLVTGDVFDVLSWNSGSFSTANFNLPTTADGFALHWSDITSNQLDVTIGAGSATNGQYTLSVVPGATKVRVSASTSLSATLTNTGTGSQDSLYYTALGSSTTTGASVTGGATSLTTGAGLPNSGSSPNNVASNSGQSFSASLAGSYTITPSGGTVSNVSDTGQTPVLKSTTTASVSAYDYANPTYTGAVLALGNVRVGDTAPTKNLALANTTISNAAFQDNLTAGATTTNSAVTVTGFTELSAGSSGNLVFSGNTSTAGSLASTATLNLTSTNTVSGLDVKSLTPSGGSVTTTGGVYAFASPTLNTASPVAFGIVHVGATQNVSVTNTLIAPSASFQDSLDVSGSGISNITVTGSNITAGATNTSGLVLTANAVGSLAGTLTIGYNSNHNGVAGLSDKTLTSGSISVTGQANFYAQPTLSQTSGAGTFSHTSAVDPISGTPTNYSLAFGTVNAGTGTYTSNLSVSNNLLSATFQDLLSGNFTILSGSGDFNLSNLTNFTNLGPGGSLGGPTVGFNSSMTAGSYTEVIQLAPVSHNGSSPDVNLSNIDLTLTGTITGSVSTPPATFTLAATPVSSAGSPIFIHVTGGPGSVVSGGTLSTVLTSTITNTGGAGTDNIVYTGLNLNASGGTLGAPTTLPTSGTVTPTGTTSASGTSTFTSNTVGQFTITPTVTSATEQSTGNPVSPSNTSTATVQVNYYASPTLSLDKGTAGSGSPSGAVVGGTLFLNVTPGSGSSAGLTLTNTTVDPVHPTFQDNLGGSFGSATTTGVTATSNTINPIASGASQTTVETVNYTSTAANSPGSYGSVTLTPTSVNSSATATLSNVSLQVQLVSTQQNTLTSNSSTGGSSGGAFGTGATWSVQNNSSLGSANSYAGLESQASTQSSANNTVAASNGYGPFLTTSAQILAGSNSGSFTGNSPATLAMSWRNRTLHETSLGEGGMPTAPPLPSTTSYLISNVLNLSGMTTASGEPVQTDPFVLQMNYNSSLVTTGTPYLAWLNPNGGGTGVPLWQHATSGNFGSGSDAIGNFMGTFAQFLSSENSLHPGLFADDPTLNPAGLSSTDLAAILGSYGVDTTGSNVWGVVNHNSQFAAGQFAVVPEPSTLLLAALGLAGIAGYRVRRRRTR